MAVAEAMSTARSSSESSGSTAAGDSSTASPASITAAASTAAYSFTVADWTSITAWQPEPLNSLSVLLSAISGALGGGLAMQSATSAAKAEDEMRGSLRSCDGPSHAWESSSLRPSLPLSLLRPPTMTPAMYSTSLEEPRRLVRCSPASLPA